MALAWDVQRRLFPEVAPDAPLVGALRPDASRRGPSRATTTTSSCASDGTVDIVVADVCGKGMAASILAASVQSAFQAWAAENFPPDRALRAPERPRLPPDEPGEVRHVHRRALRPGVRRRRLLERGAQPRDRPPGRRRARAPPGAGAAARPLPGRRPTAPAALTLGPGDLLVLYTDGITEAANPDDDEFGLDRLVALVRSVASRPLAEIEGAIGEGLAAFAAGVPFHDDRTVVLLRRL